MTFPAAPIARQVTEGGEIYIVRKAKYFFRQRGGGGKQANRWYCEAMQLAGGVLFFGWGVVNSQIVTGKTCCEHSRDRTARKPCMFASVC